MPIATITATRTMASTGFELSCVRTSAGMFAPAPVLVDCDGKQQGNAAEVGKAKELAAGFSRRLLNVEPQALAAML